jgi:hypothetical protein
MIQLFLTGTKIGSPPENPDFQLNQFDRSNPPFLNAGYKLDNKVIVRSKTNLELMS